MLHKAINAHKNGRLDEARLAYELALENYGGDSKTYRLYARLLKEIGEREKAIKALRRAFECEAKENDAIGKTKSDSCEPHEGLYIQDSSIATELAVLLAGKGTQAEAIDLAYLAIRDNPRDCMAYELLVENLGKNNRIEHALDLYNLALASVRSSFFVCKKMARFLAASGRFEESLRIRNNGLDIPKSSLSKIKRHTRIPITTNYMISHRGASPHPEINLLETSAGGENSPVYAALENATVLSGEWMVLSQDHTVFMDAHHGMPTGDPTPYYQDPANALPNAQKRAVLPEPPRKEFDKAVMVGGDPNYFHWLVDFLPRLLALGQTPSLNDYPILIHEKLLPYQREGLTFAGIAEERVQTLEYPGCYPCRELIVPLFPPDAPDQERIHSRRSAVAWLRSLVEPFEGEGRRIYISRRDSERRQIINEDHLMAALEKEGLEVLTLGGLSQKEQIEIFSQAELIVAAHGAGFGNLVFAPDHCRVVEILDPAWPNPQMKYLAAIRGQPYNGVMCRTFIAERTPPILHDSYMTDQVIDEIVHLVRI